MMLIPLGDAAFDEHEALKLNLIQAISDMVYSKPSGLAEAEKLLADFKKVLLQGKSPFPPLH